MKQQISLQEANQNLSHYIKAVEQGTEIVITRRGKPVVRMVSIEKKQKLDADQLAALKRTRARMKRGYSLGGKPPSREELHER